MNINGQVIELNDDEVKEASRLHGVLHFFGVGKAQHQANVWVQHAPDDEARERRINAVLALGLGHVIA